jgi:hypothetical protein
MMSASRKPVPAGDVRYQVAYKLTESSVEIAASASGESGGAPLRLIVPVIARNGEQAQVVNARSARIAKPTGTLIVTTDAAGGFDAEALKGKTFNLVPGFEAVAFIVTMKPGNEVRIQLRAETSQPVIERGLPAARPVQQRT